LKWSLSSIRTVNVEASVSLIPFPCADIPYVAPIGWPFALSNGTAKNDIAVGVGVAVGVIDGVGVGVETIEDVGVADADAAAEVDEALDVACEVSSPLGRC